MQPLTARSRGHRRRQIALVPAVVLLLVSIVSSVYAQTASPGMANGFEIDGNLYSNNPGVVGPGGDWLDGPPGPGTGVLNPDGSPKNGFFTLYIRDLIKNDDADIFSSSTKVTGDPNKYTWKSGSVPQKDDIQNGFIHLSEDVAGDMWITVAGDRRSVSGDSYFDFEILQNTLTKTEDHGFVSNGPHGGRTLGDILLTIELTNGGANAIFFAHRWVEDGEGGYTYVEIPFPSGTAFVAANVDSQVTTTYDAFGKQMYEVNQFGEASVNLNALLPNFGECFAIATVFARTKSSASSTADLKDFMEPFQINTCLDETPPQITIPPEVTVPCSAPLSPDDVGWAFGTDECGDPIMAYADSIVAGACDFEYTIYRKWTATDVCNNAVAGTQIIRVVDNTPPTIVSGPGPVTVQCAGDIPPPDDMSINAADDCGNVTVSHMSDVSNGRTCPEIITRTYQVVDDCGNATTHVQVITVDDTTAPQVSPLEGIVVQCHGDVPAADIGVVSATDNCGGVVVTHVADVSDGNSCPEIITRTYRATDGCGNITDVTQVIRVEDTTPPVVSGPEGATVQCHGEIPPADIGLITTSDNCSQVTVVHVDDVADGNTCPQRITRTYRVTDECGNATDHVQVFTVDDTTVPEISSGPANIEIECTDGIPPADVGLITAADNCGEVAVVHVGDVSDRNSCPERITRTYRATDLCGNSSDYTQIIVVHDTIEPTVTCAGDLTVECVGDIPAPDTGGITAGDNCGQVSVVHVEDISDGRSCPQTISRVYRVTDACGNSVDCTQKIIVKDTTPPTITGGPDPATVECHDDVPPPAVGTISATDNCSEVNVVHVDDVSDGNSCPEVVTRTYRAYDECMNYADFTQLITIDDVTPPEITSCPSDINVECPDILVFERPTATDNCDPDPDLVVVEQDSILDPEPWTFHATRTWVAVDYCGNVSEECTQKIRYHCEVDQLCTHTQGFYGNYGGKFNDVWTYDLIKAALSDSPLVVGVAGRSLKIPYGSAHCVIVRLPAGTTPTILSYSADCKLREDCLSHPKPLPMDSNGKFENVLLGQVITLGLNMRLNPPLFLFPLSETFCTQPALPGPDGLYGTEDDIRDTQAAIGTYHIAPSVLAAIDELGLWPTVQGLWELANRTLGGAYHGDATISEVNDAVDAINRGFDGCRFIVECGGGRTVAGIPGLQAGSSYDGPDPAETAPNLPTKFELGQNYPNPFNPSTRIAIAVPEAASWSLAVYNVAGKLVKRFDGTTNGAAFVDVTWNGRDANGNPVATGVYLYRVRAGRFTDTKKMIFLK